MISSPQPVCITAAMRLRPVAAHIAAIPVGKRSVEADNTAARVAHFLNVRTGRERRAAPFDDTCRALLSLSTAQILDTVDDCLLIRWSCTYIQRAVGCALWTARQIRARLAELLGGVVVSGREIRDELRARRRWVSHLPAGDHLLVLPMEAREGVLAALGEVGTRLPASYGPTGVVEATAPTIGPGVCRCPFHDDRTASFSVYPGRRDGRLLGACHATSCGARVTLRNGSMYRYDRAGETTGGEIHAAPLVPAVLPAVDVVIHKVRTEGTARGAREIVPLVRLGRRKIARTMPTARRIDLDIRHGERPNPRAEIASALGYTAGCADNPHDLPVDRLLDTCLSEIAELRTSKAGCTYASALGAPTATDCVVLDIDALQWPDGVDDARLRALEGELRAWGRGRGITDVRIQVTSTTGVQIVLLLRDWVDAGRLYGSTRNVGIFARVAAVAIEAMGAGGHLDTGPLRPGSCMRRPGWRVDRVGLLFRSYYVTGVRGPTSRTRNRSGWQVAPRAV